MEHYPDNGCYAGGPSCLACPLPICILDETPSVIAWHRNRAKDARIADAVNASMFVRQEAVAIVAQINNLTPRTVYRMIKRHQKLNGGLT